jgi:hypothetical protein
VRDPGGERGESSASDHPSECPIRGARGSLALRRRGWSDDGNFFVRTAIELKLGNLAEAIVVEQDHQSI